MEQEHHLEMKKRKRVHVVLAHSYLFYFFTFLVGLFLDFVFPISLSKDFNMAPILIGAILIFLGSILVFWAQKTSINLSKNNLTKEDFSMGPYKFIKDPTNFGIFVLIIGFGIFINAFFVILLTTISFIFSKLFFLKKEEKILTSKYGDPYLEYRKSMRFKL